MISMICHRVHLSLNLSKCFWKRLLRLLRIYLSRSFCIQGQTHPINQCPTTSAQVIECHFEYHSLLSAYKKTPRQGGSVKWGVIALTNHAHHQS